jgi:hypothetical protein
VKTTHTPGPWTVKENDKCIYIRSEKQFITVCEMRKCDIGETPKAMEEARADGRLLAAAPDLLEACKAVLGAMELGYIASGVPHSAPYSIPGPDYFSEHLARIKGAIAKAEGRAS